MRIEQRTYSASSGWTQPTEESIAPASFHLCFAFGARDLLASSSVYDHIRNVYPNAEILMCSTGGEIHGLHVYDDTVSVTAIHFDKTEIKTACVHIHEVENSFDAGRSLASSIDHRDLVSIVVLSDGQKVNGSELVKGLRENSPAGTIITGGLAGDGRRFEKTLVGLNEAPVEGRIAIVGFYGENIRINCSSVVGCSPFGPERLITRSSSNILYELDGKPALDIYKMYLGEYAVELPGSALMFPLSITTSDTADHLARTILGVNENDKSLIFAGDMPEGRYATLMRASFDRLIEGASIAAQNSLGTQKPQLAILISCVGRKWVLNHRIDEEIEVIRDVYGPDTILTGFYSYGEISASSPVTNCELHNQTMTITTFSES